MRPSVAAYLPAFTQRFEGRTHFMYLDNHKAADDAPDPLVTTGVGNLIDPVELALRLPWKNADGALASSADVRTEWELVKSLTDMASYGGQAFSSYTSLRLSDADVDALVAGKVASNERTLLAYFPGFETFPADAQLGIHSMAWAMGAAFSPGYPKFTAAANRGDWSTAAAESTIVENAPAARNAANKLLFLNAANGGNASTLYYPSKPGTTMPKIVAGIAVAVGAGWGAWRLITETRDLWKGGGG
jgi:hypothetical protein